MRFNAGSLPVFIYSQAGYIPSGASSSERLYATLSVGQVNGVTVCWLVWWIGSLVTLAGAPTTPHKFKAMSSIIATLNATVSVPGISTPVEFGRNKAGDGLILISQKALGAKLGLKGAALKRAHFAYRCEAGRKLNAGLSAAMANGDLLAKSVVPTKGGLSVKFVNSHEMTAPDSAKKAEVLAENEALKAKLAKFAKVAEMLKASGVADAEIEALLAK